MAEHFPFSSLFLVRFYFYFHFTVAQFQMLFSFIRIMRCLYRTPNNHINLENQDKKKLKYKYHVTKFRMTKIRRFSYVLSNRMRIYGPCIFIHSVWMQTDCVCLSLFHSFSHIISFRFASATAHTLKHIHRRFRLDFRSLAELFHCRLLWMKSRSEWVSEYLERKSSTHFSCVCINVHVFVYRCHRFTLSMCRRTRELLQPHSQRRIRFGFGFAFDFPSFSFFFLFFGTLM